MRRAGAPPERDGCARDVSSTDARARGRVMTPAREREAHGTSRASRVARAMERGRVDGRARGGGDGREGV